MKYLLTACLVFLTMPFAYGQDRFRVDYTHFCVYETAKDQWSEWQKGNNTFVFNVNNNNDIAFYKANGDVAYLRKLSGVEESKTEQGYEYQIVHILDEEGIRCRLQLFYDESVGLKLIYNNVIFQFAKEK
jgi:hypothetical protein